MTDANRRLEAVATGQLGAVSRSQAQAAGLTDRQLRRRVQSGVLHQHGPHAFGLPGHVDLRHRLRALVLDIGEPCWVAGPTAAALHGFDGFVLDEPLHLVLPRGRNVRRVGVVIHTTSELPPLDREERDGFPITSPARTLVDLARHVTAERLTAAVDSAIRDRLATEDLIRRRASALRSKGRFGVPQLLDVLDGRAVTRGGHSWLEREFLRLVAAAGLPRPVTQQVLAQAGGRVVRVDCRFTGTPVIVELLGHRWHRSKQQMARDAERCNALVLDGYRPFQFTYDHVVDEAATVVAVVAAALARSG
jgi:hypothetical protein